jgi:hypothetical protein
MSNDPCMDSLGYPFDEARDYVHRTPSDPRTGCSFIVCRILTFLESRLGDLVSALGWEICWMEYIWDEQNPLCYKPDHGACNQAVLSSFECLLFYCPQLLFFVLSITPRITRIDSAHCLTPGWRSNDIAAGNVESASPLGHGTTQCIAYVKQQAGWALYKRCCIWSKVWVSQVQL